MYYERCRCKYVAYLPLDLVTAQTYDCKIFVGKHPIDTGMTRIKILITRYEIGNT